MKKFIFIITCLLLTIVGHAQTYRVDTISPSSLHSEETNRTIESLDTRLLVKTGMLWGFVKYYHPAVRQGQYNIDAELYRLLPQLVGLSAAAADTVLEKWLNHFGPVDTTLAGDAGSSKIKLSPDYGYLFDTGYFSAPVIAKLERIRTCRKPEDSYYVGGAFPVGNPMFKHEQAYADIRSPDVGLRLIALYRCWNMIRYFYPDRHLTGSDWNMVLTQFIPQFLACRTDEEYFRACVSLVSCIHDTHAQVRGPGKIYERTFGVNTVPISCYFIEDQLLVTSVPDTLDLSSKIQPGDLITEIDGQEIATLAKKYAPFMSCSNNSVLFWKLSDFRSMLFSGKDTSVSLKIKRSGRYTTVRLRKTEVGYNRYRKQLFVPDTAWKLLPGNIGYIYPGLLTESDLKTAKEKLNDTKGLVIDMRCYPKTFIPYTITDWLKKENTPFSLSTTMNVNIPGLFTISEEMKCGINKDKSYEGKIVIIVNSRTISQSEFTTIAIQSAANVYTLGDTTAGADGNVSFMTLPGNVTTLISGLGILYPDGSETQRVGVRIDKIVRPTIKGVLSGEDELLTAAIKHINE